MVKRGNHVECDTFGSHAEAVLSNADLVSVIVKHLIMDESGQALFWTRRSYALINKAFAGTCVPDVLCPMLDARAEEMIGGETCRDRMMTLGLRQFRPARNLDVLIRGTASDVGCVSRRYEKYYTLFPFNSLGTVLLGLAFNDVLKIDMYGAEIRSMQLLSDYLMSNRTNNVRWVRFAFSAGATLSEFEPARTDLLWFRDRVAGASPHLRHVTLDYCAFDCCARGYTNGGAGGLRGVEVIEVSNCHCGRFMIDDLLESRVVSIDSTCTIVMTSMIEACISKTLRVIHCHEREFVCKILSKIVVPGHAYTQIGPWTGKFIPVNTPTPKSINEL